MNIPALTVLAFYSVVYMSKQLSDKDFFKKYYGIYVDFGIIIAFCNLIKYRTNS